MGVGVGVVAREEEVMLPRRHCPSVLCPFKSTSVSLLTNVGSMDARGGGEREGRENGERERNNWTFDCDIHTNADGPSLALSRGL